MKKQFFGLALMSMTLFSLVLTSCNEDNNVSSQFSEEELNDYVDQAQYEIESRGNLGRFGCYELVFPVTLSFPDETTVEVEDQEDFRTVIKTWKEANPDAEARPELAFPVEISTEDGTLVTIESAEELKELRSECKRDFFDCASERRRCHRGHGERSEKCFEIVFPISITFPDGEMLEVEDARALKTALRTWKRDNRGSEERPAFTFPIQVELEEDESIVEIADAAALAELKEVCRGN